MSTVKIKEIVPLLNTRSESGRIVLNPPAKRGPMELHTTNQIRLCCGKAFLSVSSYLQHKKESPDCSPGVILEPIEPEDDNDEEAVPYNSTENESNEDCMQEEEEEEGLFSVPIIQSVSGGDSPEEEANWIDEDAAEESDDDNNDFNPVIVDVKASGAPTVLVSEALRRLSLTPIKQEFNDLLLQENPTKRSWTSEHFKRSPRKTMINNPVNNDTESPSQSDDADTTAVKDNYVIVHDNGKKMYKCNVGDCSLSVDSIHTIRCHLENSHNPTGTYMCHFCCCQFKFLKSLNNHVLRRHPEVQNSAEVAQVADAEAKYFPVLIDNRIKWNCRSCLYSSRSVVAVKNHVMAAHESNGKFKCQHCSCSYVLPSSLKQHMGLIHPGIKQPVSKQKELKTLEAAVVPTFRTVIVGGVTRYKCKMCGYSTPKKVTVQDHIQRTHGGGKFVCGVCSNRYSTRSKLNHHLAKHRKDEESSTEKTFNPSFLPVVSVTRIDSGKYNCSSCDFYTNDVASLNRHVQIAHNPASEFACPHCSCRYAQKGHLDRHLKFTHSIPISEKQNDESIEDYEIPEHKMITKDNRKMYQCQGCKYTVHVLSQMLIHKKGAHVKDGKYPCSFCSCRYRGSAGLTQHMRIYHAKQSLPKSIENPSLPKSVKFYKVKGVSNPNIKLVIKEGIRFFHCKLCSYVSSKPKITLTHFESAHSGGNFKCPFCACCYKHRAGRSNHVGRSHPEKEWDENFLEETAASEPKPTASTWNNPEIKVKGAGVRKSFKCPIPGCPCKIRNEYETKQHLKNAHSPDARFQCTFCPCRYKSSQGLKLHLTKWHKTPLVDQDDSKSENIQNSDDEDIEPAVENETSNINACSKCQYIANSKSNLASHLKLAHVPGGIKCSKCSCRFMSNNGLNLHFNRTHGKLQKSSIGAKKLSHLSTLLKKRSVKTLNFKKNEEAIDPLANSETANSGEPKIFSCDLCDLTFSNNVSKKWHIKRAHSKWTSNKKRYPCDLCPNVYDKEGGLKIHKSKSHADYKEKEPSATPEKKRDESVDIEPKETDESKVSLFPCTMCTFATQDEKAFETHNNTDHVKDGMKCNWCSCTFSKKMNQVLHQMHQHPDAFNTSGLKWFQKETGVSDAGMKKCVEDDSDSKSVEKDDKATPISDNDEVDDNEPTKKPEKISKPINKANLVQCSKCSYKGLKVNVQLHEKNAHCKNGYDCDLCNCSYATMKGLFRHREAYHKSKMSRPTPKVQIRSQKCETCLSFFTSKAEFSRHLEQCNKTHDGIKKAADLLTTKREESKVCSKRLKKKIKPSEVIEDENKKTTEKKTGRVKQNDVKSFSPKTRPMKCPTCQKICLGPESLKSHQVRRHESSENVSGTVIEDFKPASQSSELPEIEKILLVDENAVEMLAEADDDPIAADIDVEEQHDYEEFEENNTKMYKCNQCQEYTTEFLCNIKSHFITSHSDGGFFKCDLCVCVFEKQMNLFYHKAYYHPTNKSEKSRQLIGYSKNELFRCGFCLQSCNSTTDLKSHYVKNHQNKAEEPKLGREKKAILDAMASGSKKIFIQIDQDKYVDRKIHSCGAGFSTLLDSVECKTCFQRFKKSHLPKHLQLCHSTMKTAQKCSQCLCKYATKSALQKHIDWSHKLKSLADNSESTNSESQNDSTTKPFICQKCGLRFELSSFLDLHQTVSHDGGKHPCIICSCSFSTLFALDGHLVGAHQLRRELLPAREGCLPLDEDVISVPNEDESNESHNEEESLTENWSDKEVLEEPVEAESERPISVQDNPPKLLDSDDEMPVLTPITDPHRESIPEAIKPQSICYRKVSDVISKPETITKPIYDKKVIITKKKRGRPRKGTKVEKIAPKSSKKFGSKFLKRKALENNQTEIIHERPPKRTSAQASSKLIKKFMSETPENDEAVEESPDPLESEDVVKPRRKGPSVPLDISDAEDDVLDVVNETLVSPKKRKCRDENDADYVANKIADVAKSKVSPKKRKRQDEDDDADYVAKKTPYVAKSKTSPKKRKSEVWGTDSSDCEKTDDKVRTKKHSKQKHFDIEIQPIESQNSEKAGTSHDAKRKRLATKQLGSSPEPIEKETSETAIEEVPNAANDPLETETQLELEAEPIDNDTPELVFETINVSSEKRARGRPPKRKSAEKASKIIVDVITEETSKLKSAKRAKKRDQWFKEFMKYVCSRCGNSFETNILLMVHFQGCNERCTTFPCGICPDEFPNLLKLKEHLWKIHKPATKSLSSHKIISIDEDTPEKQKPTCSLCKLVLKDKKALILHMSVPHLFRCKKCPYVCETKTLMEAHKLEKHRSKTGEMDKVSRLQSPGTSHRPKIRCLRTCVCGLRFAKPADFDLHVKTQRCKGRKPTAEQSVPDADSDDIEIVFEKTTPKKVSSEEKASSSKKDSRKEHSPNKKNQQKTRLNPINDYSVVVEETAQVSEDNVPDTPDQNKDLECVDLEDLSDANDKGEEESAGNTSVTSEPECSESMICQDCGYIASSIEDAREHNSSVGLNESQICEVCAYLGTSSCDLKMHAREHQNVESEITTTRTERQPVDFEIEFRNLMGSIVNTDELNSVGVAQEIEVIADGDHEYHSDEAGNGAVVLFNISELQNLEKD